MGNPREPLDEGDGRHEGTDQQASPRRRLRLLLAAAVVLAVSSWIVGSVYQLVRVQAAARAGRHAADLARRTGGSPSELLEGRPRRHLEQAALHFAEGRHRARSPLLWPVRALPVVGRQLRAVDALSGAAAKVAAVGIDSLDEMHDALGTPYRSGPDRVALLRRLAAIASKSTARLQGLDLGPQEALLPPVAEAHDKMARQLADLRAGLHDSESLLVGIADLLEGPHRYLLFGVSNAEMRAGAGMILSVGELESSGGELRLNGVQPVNNVLVPEGAVPVTGDLAARWGWLSPTTEWRNLLASPRFDVTAPLAASMWEAAGNRPVDGVLVLDPVALGAILDATGPVEVSGRSVTADNVVDELLVQQYLRFPKLEQRPERREELGAVAEATVATLDRTEWAVPQLAAGLLDAVRGRHLMAWSRVAPHQEAWRVARADGSLRLQSLMVSVLNRGGNKLDSYLNVRSELEVRSKGDAGEGVLRVHLRNEAPSVGPPYLLGPHPDIPTKEGDYVGLLAVNLPGATTAASIDGAPELAAAGPDGPTRVLVTPLALARGQGQTFVVRFTLPGHGWLRVEPSARVPPVRWARGSTTWRDSGARRVSW